jgi:hypothetical protein
VNVIILEKSIQVLKSCRNGSSRLPAEILCDFFFSASFVSTSFGSQSLGSTIVKYYNLGDHQLSTRRNSWPDIPMRYLCWLQEMLMRSKMAKLTVNTDSCVSPTLLLKTLKIIGSCIYEIDHVEEIDLCMPVYPKLELEENFTYVCASTSYI